MHRLFNKQFLSISFKNDCPKLYTNLGCAFNQNITKFSFAFLITTKKEKKKENLNYLNWS